MAARREGVVLREGGRDADRAADSERQSSGMGGPPQPLFQTTFGGGTYASYAVDRDGQRFRLTVPLGPEEAPPITVVLNWAAQLRR
jgi:hypothetical protein